MPRLEFRRNIVWFRRDLRVEDNEALAAAVESAELIIPLFIVDEQILARPDTGAARVIFLLDALSVLDKNLRKLGGRLIVRRGKTPGALMSAVEEFDADAVYFHEEYEPFGRSRDESVRAAIKHVGKQAVSFPGLTAVRPSAILSQAGSPYTVFTAYKKVWFESPIALPCAPPNSIQVPSDIDDQPLPTAESLSITCDQVFNIGGEDKARELLTAFVKDQVVDYAVNRDLPASSGTSKLSSHLHFGTISPRTVIHAVRNRVGAETFLSEIAWRDFYFQILYHFPHVERGAFRQNLNDIRWHDDDNLFDAWCNGRTGFPIVDAAMRQLNQEAWMHNRARMIVASFLTKDLLINWQRGEQYFMLKLVDGDLAANNGGWQWAAGTGTDAQPFFRIFNPVLQGQKFDPLGDYIKKYVPELKRVPSKVIHEPWKLTALEQAACGCVLGCDYPIRIVDHSVQRHHALALYRAAGEKNN